MRGDRPGVAPVAVEREGPGGRGGTQRVEEVGGGPQDQLGDRDLGGGGLDLARLDEGRDLLGAREGRVRDGLDAACHPQGGGLGGVDRCGDPADAGQHLGVVAHPGRVGVGEVAGALLHGSTTSGAPPWRCRRAWPAGSAGRTRSGRGTAPRTAARGRPATRRCRTSPCRCRCPSGRSRSSRRPAHARVAGVDERDRGGLLHLVGVPGLRQARVHVGPLGEDAAGRVVLRAVEPLGAVGPRGAGRCAAGRCRSRPPTRRCRPSRRRRTGRTTPAGRSCARGATAGPRPGRSARGRPAAGWRRRRRARSTAGRGDEVEPAAAGAVGTRSAPKPSA